jgi:hypothetical protein
VAAEAVPGFIPLGVLHDARTRAQEALGRVEKRLLS